jgi:hypothetical protein
MGILILGSVHSFRSVEKCILILVRNWEGSEVLLFLQANKIVSCRLEDDRRPLSQRQRKRQAISWIFVLVSQILVLIG